MTMDRVEVITWVERRRRWSAAEKARLVAAMDEPGAVVTEIAQRRRRRESSVSFRRSFYGFPVRAADSCDPRFRMRSANVSSDNVPTLSRVPG